MDVVKESWQQEVDATDPYLILHVKLARLCKKLSSWGQKRISKYRLQLQIANEIILRFDVAQESRLLSDDERHLRAACKGRCLALASLERIRLRQRAKIRNLREGDAGTAFFHMKIKSRRRKLLIPRLEHEGRIASTQHDMQNLDREYFESVMSAEDSATRRLLFEQIGLAAADLTELDVPFTEEEIWAAIRCLPNEKSPGPDGYTGLFYQKCWDIIKPELLNALAKFCTGNSQNLEKLNTAIVTLIPKKESPTLLKDYRPISLVHSFSKLAAKIMAQRLATKLDVLIPYSQTASIKGRCIHENFVYVKGLVQQFHRQKKAMVLLKLDISKAFDTVSWGFLLSMMEFRGFGPNWRPWISAIFLTEQTSILINGALTDPIKPARGPRQGESSETSWFAPTAAEASAIKGLLTLFGEATGLKTNFCKSAITPIQCSDQQRAMVESILSCRVEDFPITYLGLPLGTRQPTKAEVQPILDKLAKKVADWKPKMLSIDGRLCLIKSVLMALPVHFMSGQEEVSGGHCLVSWRKVCSPVAKGGLGVKDLNFFGQALRLKWLAKSLEQRERPWTMASFRPGCDVEAIFRSVTEYIIGNGEDTDFWTANWTGKGCFAWRWPILHSYAGRVRLSVAKALTNNRWVRTLQGALSNEAMGEFFQLWDEIHDVLLLPSTDEIRWKLANDGQFSVASAYDMFFMATENCAFGELLWHSRAPSRVRFFMWLALKDRCLRTTSPSETGHMMICAHFVSEMMRTATTCSLRVITRRRCGVLSSDGAMQAFQYRQMGTLPSLIGGWQLDAVFRRATEQILTVLSC
uniref:Reverse transcriptase n=2 Tax=Oryza sativa subsp. japonica TaxID=39947 RepID=Q94LS2_ORYSJ|nr:putative reverse transcriptase [Oryza sativa Japonica Group]